ncbi:MAG: hypothetical protein LBG45_11460 [Dysgonamonadaceae bacterium]|jgi:hypothetical protein|nr:hypothetical protein [Dysgonamonadaceae bacterium]
MNENNTIQLSGYSNLLSTKDAVSLDGYLATYKSRIAQESEELFARDFLFPLFGERNIKYVVPQYPFIDSEGRARRIDFGILYDGRKIALEVNGETYHAEGIIPDENFDDNLNRQNEILNAGWFLLLNQTGIIDQRTREIELLSFVPAKEVMRLNDKETENIIFERIQKITNAKALEIDEVSQLKELYGTDFLTEQYYLPISKF